MIVPASRLGPCIAAKATTHVRVGVKTVGFAMSEMSPLIPNSGAKADMAARRIRTISGHWLRRPFIEVVCSDEV
jgi:hypothetical protein